MPASRELIVSYHQRISELHEQSVAADQAVRDALTAKLEITRQTGETIKAAKGDLGEREFAEATDFLSSDAVRTYLKLVRLNPGPISDLETGLRVIRESMQATGALEFPSGHGVQISHDPPPFFTWVGEFVMQFKVKFHKYIGARPIDSWDCGKAEQFLFQLRPILKVHKQVADWLRQQSAEP